MKDIKVEKESLLEIIKKNRDNHRVEFEKALDGWYNLVMSELNQLKKAALAKKDVQYYLNMPRPDDHTDDYDRAIQMLELDIEDVTTLSERDFQQLVQDDWGWKDSWTASNQTYYAASTIK